MCTCHDKTADWVRDSFLAALERLHDYDAALGGANAPGKGRSSEQSLVARIGHYMAVDLDCEEPDDRSHLRVDVEYSRHEDTIKEPPPELDSNRMVVDLCVHIRRSQERNLLVVEAKAPPRTKEDVEKIANDRCKLRWVTWPDGPYRYQWGALLLLDGRVHWFRNGKETGETTDFAAIVTT